MKIGTCCILCFLIILSASQPLWAETHQTIEIIVEKYDNLSSISKKHLEDFRQWPEVARFNGLDNADLIHPGQKILIPIHLLKGRPLQGEITFIRGNVQIQARGTEDWHRLHLGDTVWHENRIITGDDSAVEVTYQDGTSFFLRANTDVTLRTAVQKRESLIIRKLIQRTGRITTRLKKATGRESRYEIQTPSAVAAARGTDFRVSVDTREVTRSEVLSDRVVIEAMRQQVTVNEGEGTLVRKNESPLKPRKLLPPPALINPQTLYRLMPMQLKFATPEGTLSVRVMISRDSGIKDVIKEMIVKTGETLDIANLDDGSYFLQSLSIDQDGIEGLPSMPEKIQVRINPLPPFIQTPEDASELRETSTEFSWLNVPDAAGYHLQIAEDREFQEIVIDRDNISDTAFTESLSFGSYFFRVRSIADDGYRGVWSDTLTFAIIPPPPAPDLETPAMNEDTIQLRWRGLGDGISYRFQMARDDQFNDILLEEKLDKPMIIIQKPKAVGVYFVRTSGIDAEGYEGDFSLPQSLEIKQITSLKTLGVIGTIFLMLVVL